MKRANLDIIQEAKEAGVKLWQIAERFNGGMNDSNFSRKLRHDFSAEEKSSVRAIIAKLKEGE